MPTVPTAVVQADAPMGKPPVIATAPILVAFVQVPLAIDPETPTEHVMRQERLAPVELEPLVTLVPVPAVGAVVLPARYDHQMTRSPTLCDPLKVHDVVPEHESVMD